MSKKRIIFYTGCRADYGLLEPIVQKIYSRLETYLVVGPHHQKEIFGKTSKKINKRFYKKIFYCGAKIDYTNVNVTNFISNSSKNYKKIINNVKPSLIVVLGDRYEVLSFTIAAFFERVNICHIHGGEKTIGSFDDTIRHVISKFSAFHFSSNHHYKNRLVSMGEKKENIFNFGSVGAEIARKFKFENKKKIFNLLGINTNKKIILATFHPETNSAIEYSRQIRIFLSALKGLKNNHIVFTASNPDPSGKMFNDKIKNFVKLNSNSSFFYSLGNKNYLNLAKFCELVLGNSSSAIIEVPSLGIPVLNIGVRQLGRVMSKNIYNCILKKVSIEKKIFEILAYKNKKYSKKNPYHKKNAVRNISKKILKLVKIKNSYKYFND